MGSLRSVWRFESLGSRAIREEELHAYWEVEGDPISDDFNASDVTAEELLLTWARHIGPKYSSGLIPIHWFVRSEAGALVSLMPFQFPHTTLSKNFLTEFSWPVSIKTGERSMWVNLPVNDKRWNTAASEKGGFIQEATNWKPSALQPFVFLPSLLESQ